MGTAALIGLLLQAVQAGFALTEIKKNVDVMTASGATEAEVHTYLRSLAHKNQDALEQA